MIPRTWWGCDSAQDLWVLKPAFFFTDSPESDLPDRGHRVA